MTEPRQLNESTDAAEHPDDDAPVVVRYRLRQLEARHTEHDAKQSRLEGLLVATDKILTEVRATMRLALAIGAFALATAVGALISIVVTLASK